MRHRCKQSGRRTQEVKQKKINREAGCQNKTGSRVDSNRKEHKEYKKSRPNQEKKEQSPENKRTKSKTLSSSIILTITEFLPSVEISLSGLMSEVLQKFAINRLGTRVILIKVPPFSGAHKYLDS